MNRGKTIALVAGIVVVAAAAAAFLLLRPPPRHDIRGRLAAPECGGGYAIDSSQVELRNEKNEIIGSAQTSEDKLSMFPTLGCVVTFTIPDVPETSFYSIEIGTHEGPNYSLEQIRSQNWTMALGLEGAVTEYPVVSQDALCDIVEDLNFELNDVNLYNDDRDTWASNVETEAELLAMAGAGYSLNGNVEKAESIAEMTDPLVDISKLTEAFLPRNYFDKLNERMAPANAHAGSEVVGCTWNRVEFIPAN